MDMMRNICYQAIILWGKRAELPPPLKNQARTEQEPEAHVRTFNRARGSSPPLQ